MINWFKKKELVAWERRELIYTRWGVDTGGRSSTLIYYYLKGDKRIAETTNYWVDLKELPSVQVWLVGGPLPLGVNHV